MFVPCLEGHLGMLKQRLFNSCILVVLIRWRTFFDSKQLVHRLMTGETDDFFK